MEREEGAKPKNTPSRRTVWFPSLTVISEMLPLVLTARPSAWHPHLKYYPWDLTWGGLEASRRGSVWGLRPPSWKATDSGMNPVSFCSCFLAHIRFCSGAAPCLVWHRSSCLCPRAVDVKLPLSFRNVFPVQQAETPCFPSTHPLPSLFWRLITAYLASASQHKPSTWQKLCTFVPGCSPFCFLFFPHRPVV